MNGLVYLDAKAHPSGHSTWSLSFLASTFSHPNNLQPLAPGVAGTACMNTWTSEVVG